MSDLLFNDRVAIVTGAGRGLGREHALLLAHRGAAVVVNDLGTDLDGTGSSSGPADEVVAEITAAGGRAVASPASVTSVEGAETIVRAALDNFGRLDMVVNNAGINVAGALDEMPMDLFDRVFDISFRGTLNVTRAAWPHLKAAGYGRIVNTTSHAFHGWTQLAAYSSAKAAVYGLTRTLAAEGAESGIKVNAIAPAGFTRMTTSTGIPPEMEAFLKQVLVTQFPSVAMALLAHDSCPLTGEVLSVCGGRVARLYVAETEGIIDPELTVDTLSAHLKSVLDESGAKTYASGEENLMTAIGLVAAEMQRIAGSA
jgi:NAD(P)-dependent dehydrogenase (short-subunit alcohol dehydrogenase family)